MSAALMILDSPASVAAVAPADPAQSNKIVYIYVNNPDADDGVPAKPGTFLNEGGLMFETTYRKPPAIPGSRNYVVDRGGDDERGKEVADFRILSKAGKTLFLSHGKMGWSMRSSTVLDSYFMLTEPQALEAALLGKPGDSWRSFNQHASSNDYSYPYRLIEVSRSHVWVFRCFFDNRQITDAAARKALMSPIDKALRPYPTMMTILRLLAQHGTDKRADRCLRLKM